MLATFVSALLITPSSASANIISSKTVCSARELRGQDCRLAMGSHRIRLLAETVARDDGTWHTVDPMPLKGEGVAWEKVTFDVQHGIPLLQMWIWDAGQGQAAVQDLHWFTTDARRGALKIMAEGVVRRRRVRPSEDKKVNYLYDGWEKHSAKILANGKLEWQLGAEKKILETGAPDKGHEHGI